MASGIDENGVIHISDNETNFHAMMHPCTFIDMAGEAEFRELAKDCNPVWVEEIVQKWKGSPPFGQKVDFL